MPRRVNMPTPEASKITEKSLLEMAGHLKSGLLPMERTFISDDIVAGLRALVSKTGEISYHANYFIGADGRKMLKIGSANKESPDYLPLADARKVTQTIKDLADRGINAQDGLMPRLVRELLRDGSKWRVK